jgi:hypothetical protein
MKSYFPSNGTDGEYFISKWCEKCVKDTNVRGGKKCCQILNKSLLGMQPKEWVIIGEVPQCTAFVKLATVKKKKKIIENLKLF